MMETGGDECIDGEGERAASPWPYLKDLFEFKSANDNNFIMQCKLCMLKDRQLSTHRNSASNLRKHIQRKHPSKMKQYTDLVAARKQTLEPEKPQASKQKQVH